MIQWLTILTDTYRYILLIICELPYCYNMCSSISLLLNAKLSKSCHRPLSTGWFTKHGPKSPILDFGNAFIQSRIFGFFYYSQWHTSLCNSMFKYLLKLFITLGSVSRWFKHIFFLSNYNYRFYCKLLKDDLLKMWCIYTLISKLVVFEMLKMYVLRIINKNL